MVCHACNVGADVGFQGACLAANAEAGPDVAHIVLCIPSYSPHILAGPLFGAVLILVTYHQSHVSHSGKTITSHVLNKFGHVCISHRVIEYLSVESSRIG